jgi:hypothetical protein
VLLPEAFGKSSIRDRFASMNSEVHRLRPQIAVEEQAGNAIAVALRAIWIVAAFAFQVAGKAVFARSNIV